MFRIISAVVTVVGAAVLASASFAGTATGTKAVPFLGTYSGTATAQLSDDYADLSAKGKGTAKALGGASTITGVGSASGKDACIPWGGTGKLAGKLGALTFKVVSATGCGDEDGKVFSLTGKAQVTKGTLKLAKAKGTLRFTGIYDRGAGTFSVKFTGTLAA